MSFNGKVIAEQEEILPDNGWERNGATAVDDRTLTPTDTGSDSPQDEDGFYLADMASLKDTLRRTAARIERECGGKCRCEALVSSEDNGTSGFLVWLTLDGGSLKGGETFMGNARDLDGAEEQARRKADVWLAERQKAAAASPAHELAKRAEKGAVANG